MRKNIFDMHGYSNPIPLKRKDGENVLIPFPKTAWAQINVSEKEFDKM